MAKIRVSHATQFFEVTIRIEPETQKDREELSRLWKVFDHASGQRWNPSDSIALDNVNVILRFNGDSYELIITDL